MPNAGAFVVAIAGAALNLSMVWRNDPTGVYEQGRYRLGLIRNLGDLIAPSCSPPAVDAKRLPRTLPNAARIRDRCERCFETVFPLAVNE